MPPDEPDHLVDVHDAANYVARLRGQPCAPGTIRSWASRGHIGRHGRRRGRTMYDLRELHRWATSEDPEGDTSMTEPRWEHDEMANLGEYAESIRVEVRFTDRTEVYDLESSDRVKIRAEIEVSRDPIEVDNATGGELNATRIHEQPCALWYDRGYGRIDYDLEDGEAEAARWAVVLEDSDEPAAILGVQFADGRTIPATHWGALAEAREQARQEEANRPVPPPIPTHTMRDPFRGDEVEVEDESPAWVGR